MYWLLQWWCLQGNTALTTQSCFEFGGLWVQFPVISCAGVLDAALTSTWEKTIQTQWSVSFHRLTSDGDSLSVLKNQQTAPPLTRLTGRSWFWRRRPCSRWWRSTFPGRESRPCRPLLPPPRHCGRSCPADRAASGRSAPRGAGSAAGRERSGWWASAGWCWSGRSRLERETHFRFLHLTVM